MEDGTRFTGEKILGLFELLEGELAQEGAEGEVYPVRGAGMSISFDARAATRDVDASFRPTRTVREAAARVAAKAGVRDDWLNDAVK